MVLFAIFTIFKILEMFCNIRIERKVNDYQKSMAILEDTDTPKSVKKTLDE